MPAQRHTNGDAANSSWQAFSDYDDVPQRVSDSVAAALEEYAKIHSMTHEGAKTDAMAVALARTHMIAAGLRIKTEIDQTLPADADPEENLQAEILERWESNDGEPGLIEKLHEEQLTGGYGTWLHQFIIDLRQAAWDLGYLQAGKHERVNDDPVEDETDQMIQEMA